ncbi:MAG: WG repeat-containing protein, partial [Ruminococcus sp.]|nr:WG repeat-containing protein [Ruminococcus sp.]
PTERVKKFYINNILETREALPEETLYWLKAINFYKEKNDYSSAYNMVKKARRNEIKNDELDSVYLELRYMTKTDYHKYDDYKTTYQYISAHDSNGWQVIGGNGNIVSSEFYSFIGLINDDGVGIYTNSIDTRLVDKYGVTRARFDFDADDAGIYDSETRYTPVCINGKWKYVDLNGEFLPDEYEKAGCFKNGKAAVKKDNKWFLIDKNGNQVSDNYEEIKLDFYGSYLQGNVIIAKNNGRCSIYDTSFKEIGNFSCENIDACLNNGWIAYEENGKWGFVNTNGEIVVEPSYQCAKSFSNGMAAVYNGTKWGFINEQNQLVIDYQFINADYFNSGNYCMVSVEEGTSQIMYLMFN